MKLILTLFLFLYSSCFLFSQKIEDLNKIAFGYKINDSSLSENSTIKLANKISQIINYNNYLLSNDSDFIINVKVNLIDSKIVESGLENSYIVKGGILLEIEQKDQFNSFSSLSKQLVGVGKSEEQAINNLISNIKHNDNYFKSYLNSSNEKIINYYNNNCNSIIDKALNLSKTGNYEESLFRLMTIPEVATSCYNSAQIKSLEIFKSFKEKSCQSNILEAKSLIAKEDYTNALNILNFIDPSTTCFKQAEALINKIENYIADEKKKDWELKIKSINNKHQLDLDRVRAIKDIAVSYYNSRPRVYILR